MLFITQKEEVSEEERSKEERGVMKQLSDWFQEKKTMTPDDEKTRDFIVQNHSDLKQNQNN